MKPAKEWLVQQNESWRLVSDDLWNAVQEVRKRNSEARPGFGRTSKRASYALSGLIVCGVCGMKFGGKWQKSKNQNFGPNSNYHYYRCFHSMNGGSACSNKAKLRGKVLEEAVLQRLLDQIADDNFVSEIADEITEIQKQETAQQNDRSGLERRRDELCAELEKLIGVAAKVDGQVDLLAKRIADCEQERKRIEEQISQVAPAPKLLPTDVLKTKIRHRLKNVRDLFRSTLKTDDLRCALKRWIDAIRVDADGKVFIKWKLASVFELLELPPASVMALAGYRSRHNGHSLGDWQLLLAPSGISIAFGVASTTMTANLTAQNATFVANIGAARAAEQPTQPAPENSVTTNAAQSDRPDHKFDGGTDTKSEFGRSTGTDAELADGVSHAR